MTTETANGVVAIVSSVANPNQTELLKQVPIWIRDVIRESIYREYEVNLVLACQKSVNQSMVQLPEKVRCHYVQNLGSLHSYFPFHDEAVASQLRQILTSPLPSAVLIDAPEFFRGAIISAIKDFPAKCFYLATDFLSICPRYNLYRGDGNRCIAGPVSLTQCQDCNSTDSLLHRRLLKRTLARIPRNLLRQSLIYSRNASSLSSIWRMTQSVSDHWSGFELFRKHVDGIIVPSYQTASILKSYGWGDVPILVQPWSVSIGATSDSLIGEDAPFTIGYSGRQVHEKGLHLLLEAIQMSVKDGLKIRLVVFGNNFFNSQGSYSQVLKRAGSQIEDLISFDFYDGMDKDSIAAAMSRIDLLAVPSLWVDNIPRVALEALGFGVPVLYGTHTSLGEVCQQGMSGYAVNIEGLGAKAISEFCSNSYQQLLDNRRQARKPQYNVTPTEFGSSVLNFLLNFDSSENG